MLYKVILLKQMALYLIFLTNFSFLTFELKGSHLYFHFCNHHCGLKCEQNLVQVSSELKH